jgi:hypothetical protein
MQKNKQTDKHANTQTDKHTNSIHMYRQTDRQTEKQTQRGKKQKKKTCFGHPKTDYINQANFKRGMEETG